MARLETKLMLKAADRVTFLASDSGYYWLSAFAGASFDDPHITVHFADADQVRAVRDAMSKALAEHDALQAAKAAAKASLEAAA